MEIRKFRQEVDFFDIGPDVIRGKLILGFTGGLTFPLSAFLSKGFEKSLIYLLY
jgi:hypothetical protein